jgi:glycosyltransferase involved in cell wall biosynthesis
VITSNSQLPPVEARSGPLRPRGRVAGLIAAHNEARQIGAVVNGGRKHIDQWLVVADGCSDDTVARAAAAGAEVLAWPKPCGKASALRAGWRHLLNDPAIGAIAMLDGDGQHDPADLPWLLEAWRERSCALVVGQRNLADAAMPAARRLTNRFMSAVIRRLAHAEWGDTQCGFRLASRAFLLSRHWQATHFELETEMLLHAAAAGWPVSGIPVRTIYTGQPSHIRALPDCRRWLRLLMREFPLICRPPAAPRKTARGTELATCFTKQD